mmetsp:Transcript_108773/g.307655  ORF Transcript_108773/g.307655 Transcript_108773/m.307655 type:complete len:653 (-) Transcript_108773:129-2087(-)
MAAAEPGTRFAHLLQPIRDLSKVWKIEIADELERYIEEVAQLVVTNPTDGITQLNFAEAALLIQGSTAIYSRKVELLYQLVCQALDLLNLSTGKDAHGKKGKAVQSGLWAPIPDTEQLLTIDHLIKEGRSTVLEHNGGERRQALQRRVPLFLMPRDQTDRRKKEFRISTCTVHHTGVYLLQESDARLLDELLSVDDEATQGCDLDAPLVPAPPREVQDLDDRLQELLRELPEEDPVEGLDTVEDSPGKEAGEKEKEGAAPQTPQKLLATPGPGGGSLEQQSKLQDLPDPWALLDEHETVGQDLPLEVGKTTKRINAKKLLVNAEGLPDVGSAEEFSDEALWSGNAAAIMAPMLTAGNPVESLFLAVAGHLKSGGQYETQRVGFSAAWFEFEDLFAAAMGQRRQLKSLVRAHKGVPAAPDDGGASEDEGPCDGGGKNDIAATPQKLTDVDVPKTPGTILKMPMEVSEESRRREEQRKEVAMLENMIEDAQHKYESTVRQHLQAMQKDSVDTDNRKFPQLYANVRKWQDQLEPVLKTFESRPDFNIDEYGTKFLSKVTDMQKRGGEGPDSVIPFPRLVRGQPRWEVCRRFLTCLILTNQGNTDIVFKSEEERLNKFGIKLISAEKRKYTLDEDEAGAEAAGGAGKTKKARKTKA